MKHLEIGILCGRGNCRLLKYIFLPPPLHLERFNLRATVVSTLYDQKYFSPFVIQLYIYFFIIISWEGSLENPMDCDRYCSSLHTLHTMSDQESSFPLVRSRIFFLLIAVRSISVFLSDRESLHVGYSVIMPMVCKCFHPSMIVYQFERCSIDVSLLA